MITSPLVTALNWAWTPIRKAAVSNRSQRGAPMKHSVIAAIVPEGQKQIEQQANLL